MLRLIGDTERDLAPTFLCDTCGRPVTAANSAVVLFRREGLNKPIPLEIQPLYLHQGLCESIFVEKHGGNDSLFGKYDLTAYLYRLLRNAGLLPEDMVALGKRNEETDLKTRGDENADSTPNERAGSM